MPLLYTLRKTALLWPVILWISVLAGFVHAQGFLTTRSQKIVDGNGDEYILKGMGLGGWMLQEGYMLCTSGFADAQHEIEKHIAGLTGEAFKDRFYDAWLKNHFRRIDLDSLKSWGFNSVRIAMHYKWFTPPIEQEPLHGRVTWRERGFRMLDILLKWCGENRMYLILDLHAAPGGQGYNASIRKVDPDHIIFVEGNCWANNFSGMTPPWDDNMVYSFHKYWNPNDREAIQQFLHMRMAPVYGGG